jgi:short-subunit dehydrogenase
VQLDGRRALVTGATGGIGKAIARALHERGAHVLLTGRRAEVLDELVTELGGQRCEAVPADLASADDVRSLLDRAGRVDVLVANAALPGSGRLDEYSTDEIQRALDVNLGAPIHLARALVPEMIDRGEGHLVFISSISGKVASPRGSIYAATKFGLRGFATSLHAELRDQGVGVTTVFPGFISDAGMWAETGLKLRPGVSTRTPEQVAAGVIKGIDSNKSEIDVAPLVLRAGGWAAGISQSAVQRLQRLGGGDELAEQMAEGQRAKR